MSKPRIFASDDDNDMEDEFGVPFPGKILSQEQWARTAIKKLPDDGPLDWAAIFGRSAPLILDLGCGNGRFTIASALARSQYDHVGIDILPVVIRYATRRANQRGLHNVRFAVRGALEFLRDLIAPQAVREIHIYHPQPYHDREKADRRLLTPPFFRLVHHSLEPEGLFVIQTDNPMYWRYISTIALHFFDFHYHKGPWADALQGRSRREIIARRQGLKIFRGFGKPRSLGESELDRLTQSLPLPTFDTCRSS